MKLIDFRLAQTKQRNWIEFHETFCAFIAKMDKSLSVSDWSKYSSHLIHMHDTNIRLKWHEDFWHFMEENTRSHHIFTEARKYKRRFNAVKNQSNFWQAPSYIQFWNRRSCTKEVKSSKMGYDRFHAYYNCCRDEYDTINTERGVSRPCPSCNRNNNPTTEVSNNVRIEIHFIISNYN